MTPPSGPLLAARQDAGAPAPSPPELPPWVDAIGAAVWISGPDRRIAHVNDRALQVLGVERRECVGAACHAVVAGATETGSPFCRARCPLVERAERGRALAPVAVKVVARGVERWLQLVVIPLVLDGRDGTWLLHVALDVGRAKRAEAYLECVASRPADVPAGRRLTPREREVLHLLAGGATPDAIARRLHVSPCTARNHVQHILAKLEAHSIQEAVARYLLDGPAEGDRH